ncbi:hypothetical protein ACFWH4_01620 [Streptomyces sp. NPDC127091]|uniref:hypothetical protein n=1 Tax=Streptomyces sp. NPDC127091 TaxID=3347134 RepID=UPI0036681895
MTSRECSREAERLLDLATRDSQADPELTVAMAAVYAQLAQAAAAREAADRTTEK